jgi:hypothetical protein
MCVVLWYYITCLFLWDQLKICSGSNGRHLREGTFLSYQLKIWVRLVSTVKEHCSKFLSAPNFFHCLILTPECNANHTVIQSRVVYSLILSPTVLRPWPSNLFYVKGQPPILWAGSQATCDTISGVPNCLNYCVIFIMCTVFTGMQDGGLFLKFGASIWEVILNLLMKRRTKSL